MIHYDTLLQNATDIITKYDSYFFYKIRQKFITKSDSFITKYDSYYELQRFYYKMRCLLQIATIHTSRAGMAAILQLELNSLHSIIEFTSMLAVNLTVC